MSAPQIPARPARSQNQAGSTLKPDNIPSIPPRPKRTPVDRAISPNRDSFARSPLNDPSFIPNGKSKNVTNDYLGAAEIERSTSVDLPSIGQEGNEYANLESYSKNYDAPAQTKNIAGDLPLHAPKASLPASSAKARVATVTRIDSSQAAAAGIGKAQTDYDPKAASVKSSPRPASIRSEDKDAQQYAHEHGIPEIGVQIPLFKHAGDVQAPTPTPPVQQLYQGAQSAPRHHGRTKSGREIFRGPPGSYGLHGHGKVSADPFEKAWYEKHPEDLAKEIKGEYGPHISEERKEYMLSSEELNKLVHGAGQKGIGMGASADVIGTPDEQIGYIAHEEYASRMASPRPATTHDAKKRTSSSHQHTESPLRKMSLPNEASEKPNELARTSSRAHAIESETEDDIIHIDPPSRRHSKIHGQGFETEDLGRDAGNTEEKGGIISDKGYGVPILASDEVAKRPDAEFLQPAVSPELDRHGDVLHNDAEAQGRRRSTERPSRQGTQNLARFEDMRSPPLEDVKEYEPLFPEDEDEPRKIGEKPKMASDKLKRPDMVARHHFPSQDRWEDTPDSLQLQTTVETPQVDLENPDSAHMPSKPAAAFETPEQEAARKQQLEPNEQQSFLPDHTKKFAKQPFNKDIQEEVVAARRPGRPGMSHRFPSRDIWEDSPDSMHFTTTVETPEPEAEDKEVTSPTDGAADSEAPKPIIPPRPVKGDVESSKPTPTISTRPEHKISPIQSREEGKETSPERQRPSVPERPKPQIPARPARTTKPETSIERETSPAKGEAPTPKAKPPVPSRPLGGKIAALKAGFMNDLNSRLQLGPQAPKKEEPAKEEVEEEKEKVPLADARKGRAKGPQRRKPAASPAGVAATATETPKEVKMTFASSSTIFSIDDDGELDVGSTKVAKTLERADTAGSEEPQSVVSEHKGDSAELPPAEPISTKEADVEPASAAAEVALPSDESSKPEAKSEEPSMTSSAAQTGEVSMDIHSTDGSSSKLTTYLGGRAPEEGTVVVKDDGEEVVNDVDARNDVVKTGHGM